MKCPKCGEVNLSHQKFCGECGTKFAPASLVQPRFADWNYTPRYLAEQILRTRSALEGERKQVTVLFCDIADSTPLANQIGPDNMHKVLNAFFEAAAAEVHRFEGTVNQFLGDGFMALFGAPLSHEDHARRAVLSALSIRTVIGRDARLEALGVSLKTRIGLHTGVVVVGRIGDNLRMDYTAIGDTTNVAARIQALAEPNKILASESVVRSTAAFVQSMSIGLRALKGKLDPVALHEIVREDAQRAHDTKNAGELVGRRQELDVITRQIERLHGGEGSAIAIVGEAGLGKSRLLEEACRLAHEQCSCPPRKLCVVWPHSQLSAV